jgi:hypothetical protein
VLQTSAFSFPVLINVIRHKDVVGGAIPGGGLGVTLDIDEHIWMGVQQVRQALRKGLALGIQHGTVVVKCDRPKEIKSPSSDREIRVVHIWQHCSHATCTTSRVIFKTSHDQIRAVNFILVHFYFTRVASN